MKFAFQFACKTIKKKPFRAALMILLVMMLSGILYLGAVTVISLQNGLSGYRARLGADIIVVPASATSHGTVDDILLQGITGNYYMNGKDVGKVLGTEGIGESTTQFFLTSAKASCCSSRVQIIGYDPETDFSIHPWIRENYSSTVSDGDVVVGANINIPENGTLTFYGKNYHVAAQLAATGTGLDSAVYANMDTVRQMAENSSLLLANGAFAGVDIGTAASAVLLNVEDGYSISDVVDDINIHITKVEAAASGKMVENISEGLGGVSRVIGILVAAVWVLAVVILIAVFALLSNERKKEFAVLRVLGASRKMLFSVMGTEAGLLSLAGAAAGILAAAVLSVPLSDALKNMLDLPFLAPSAAVLAGIAAGALILSAAAGLGAALLSARRIAGSETGLLLREDA